MLGVAGSEQREGGALVEDDDGGRPRVARISGKEERRVRPFSEKGCDLLPEAGMSPRAQTGGIEQERKKAEWLGGVSGW